MSYMTEMHARLEARKAWEAEHPALAAEWAEAMAEDARRDREREVAACEARADSVAPSRLRELGVPDLAVQHSLAPWSTDAVRAARKFIRADKRMLLLCGTKGTGKTTAAAVVLRWWLLRCALAPRPTCAKPPPVAMFERATTFARMSAYDRDDKAYFDELCRCGLLVMDDVGAETLAGVAPAMLDELMDVRYGSGRRTVITSNLSGSAFKARYGERIADRIRECGIVETLTGSSMRGKARPQETTP